MSDHRDHTIKFREVASMNSEEPYLSEMPLRSQGMQSHPAGIGSYDIKTLRAFVAPIYDCLSSIDAEDLLSLERVDQGGAQLGNGCVT